jgi:hypothetical protein
VRLCVCASLFAQQTEAAQRITRDIIPQVERAVGLKFKRPPVVAVRSRDQLRLYLERKVRHEYPPAELRAEARAYRAFRLVADTVDLLKMQLDLLQEQVAGFYDPDSTTLFVIAGGDPMTLRAVISHELVHALQDQYTNLNAIRHARRQSDRQTAGQAVMEGQATVAGMLALTSLTAAQLAERWDQVRSGVRDQQESFGQLAAAPLILRESLLFPYIAGAEFILGFETRRTDPDAQPFNARLPVSTEQILHASRYTAGERPVRVSLAPSPGDTLVYDDDFGEFGARVALRSWGVSEPEAIAAAAGWNGDRYVILGTRAGTALVWATAWDTPQDAVDFERTLRRGWARTAQGRADAAARRWQVDTLGLAGVNVVRLVDAPAAWTGWARLPAPRISR